MGTTQRTPGVVIDGDGVTSGKGETVRLDEMYPQEADMDDAKFPHQPQKKK